MPPSRRGRVSRPSLTTLMFFVLLSCTTLLLGHVWINFRHKGHMPQGILFRLFRRVVAGPAAPVDEEGEMVRIPQKVGTQGFPGIPAPPWGR